MVGFDRKWNVLHDDTNEFVRDYNIQKNRVDIPDKFFQQIGENFWKVDVKDDVLSCHFLVERYFWEVLFVLMFGIRHEMKNLNFDWL